MPSWKPTPPKSSETDGKAVKKRKVNKLLGRPEEEPTGPIQKKLDKPTKLVYNIRKDVTGLQYLYDTFLLDVTKSNRNLPFKPIGRIGDIETASAVVMNIIAREQGIPTPKLAGGALRDLVFNRSPKDYDYFINCDDEDQAYEVIDKLCLALCNDPGNTPYEERGQGATGYETEDEEFEGVYGVFNQTKFGLDLQFIVGVWPEAKEHIYDKFDLSVCQVEMDIETGDITFADAFMETLVTQEIKLLRDTKYSRDRKETQSWNLSLHGKASQVAEFKTLKNRSLNTYGDLLNVEGIRIQYANLAREMLNHEQANQFQVRWEPVPVELLREQ
jgi:hypothetical protein